MVPTSSRPKPRRRFEGLDRLAWGHPRGRTPWSPDPFFGGPKQNFLLLRGFTFFKKNRTSPPHILMVHTFFLEGRNPKPDRTLPEKKKFSKSAHFCHFFFVHPTCVLHETRKKERARHPSGPRNVLGDPTFFWETPTSSAICRPRPRRTMRVEHPRVPNREGCSRDYAFWMTPGSPVSSNPKTRRTAWVGFDSGIIQTQTLKSQKVTNPNPNPGGDSKDYAFWMTLASFQTAKDVRGLGRLA